MSSRQCRQCNEAPDRTRSASTFSDGEWTIVRSLRNCDTHDHDPSIEDFKSGDGAALEPSARERRLCESPFTRTLGCPWRRWLAQQHEKRARQQDKLLHARTRACAERQRYNDHRVVVEAALSKLSEALNPESTSQSTDTLERLHQNLRETISLLRTQSKKYDAADNHVLTLEFQIAGEESKFTEILQHVTSHLQSSCNQFTHGLTLDDEDEITSQVSEVPTLVQRLHDRMGDASLLQERMLYLDETQLEAESARHTEAQDSAGHLNRHQLAADLLAARQDIQDIQEECRSQGVDLSHLEPLCRDDSFLERTQQCPGPNMAGVLEERMAMQPADNTPLCHENAFPDQLESSTSAWARKAWEIWGQTGNRHSDSD